MPPTCSLIIPTKDRPGLLPRAVRSALVAIPQQAEVLVVDDHSAMPATQVLQDINDSRLKILSNPGRSGVSYARNFGVEQARGKILFFLDDDDEILPHYCNYVLETVLQSEFDPEYGFASYYRAKDDAQGGWEASPKVWNQKLPDGPVSLSSDFKRRISGFGTGFWIRKMVFDVLGPIDESLATNEDTEFSCRLMSAGSRAWFSAQPAMRIHDHSTLGGADIDHVTRRIHDKERADCFRRIIGRHQELLNRDPGARAHLAHRFIKLSVKAGQIAEVKKFCRDTPDLIFRQKLYLHVALNRAIYALKKVSDDVQS